MTTPGNGRAHAGAKLERFDLDAAAEAARTEANAVPFGFTWKGKPYEIPAISEWPAEVLDLVGEGELGKAMAILLPAPEPAKGQPPEPSGWDRLKADGLTVGALNVLFEQAGIASGVGNLPNSPPPTGRATTRT